MLTSQWKYQHQEPTEHLPPLHAPPPPEPAPPTPEVPSGPFLISLFLPSPSSATTVLISDFSFVFQNAIEMEKNRVRSPFVFGFFHLVNGFWDSPLLLVSGVHSFPLLNIIFHCMQSLQCGYPFASCRTFGLFSLFLAIINKTARNMHVKVFVWACVFTPLR